VFGGSPLAVVAVALAGLATTPSLSSPAETSSKAEDAADTFVAEGAALCTDIVSERSFEESDAASAAGLDVLAFALHRPGGDWLLGRRHATTGERVLRRRDHAVRCRATRCTTVATSRSPTSSPRRSTGESRSTRNVG